MNTYSNNIDPDDKSLWQPDLIYSLLLFLVAFGAIAYCSQTHGILMGEYGFTTAAFFIVFGLFTITTGFPHPGFGHVSFDRVSQVASILVLGPIDAAWINGLASFIYPWHRLRGGADLKSVITAACNNAGLMALVILLCGSLYEFLGGPIPLTSLDLRIGGLLLLLMLSMQFVNDLGMMIILYLRGISPSSLLNTFTTAVESVSVLIAVVVALAFTTADRAYFALLLVVLGIGMLVLKQYALMRHRLETLVDERTEELHQKSIELERQATHDQLTGLVNRRFADDYLQREIETAQRYDRDFTIALADIDHFKQINDRFSHAIGDEVLRRIAQILLNRCRKTDVVARYGGEEFLLCFPDTDAEFAEQICSQMRAGVEHADWSDLQLPGGDAFKVTISFGIAERGNDTRRATILGNADARLYQAKHRGRNRIIARD
jgi:diguanylate cyclase (GGDEF)-like protein